MKRKIFMVIGLVAALGLISTGVAHAASSTRSGDNVTVSEGEVLRSSLYASGSTITVAGTVEGDVFCAGETIQITGTVTGDVLCAGKTVHIDGHVLGDVRAAGQDLTASGRIDGALTVAGETVLIPSRTTIKGDVTAFGSSLTVAGNLGRDLTAGGDSTLVSGNIARDVNVMGESLVLDSTANVKGGLAFTSNNQATINSGAIVVGPSTHHTPPVAHTSEGSMFDQYVSTPLYWLAALLLVGLIGVYAAPGLLAKVASTIQRRPLATLGVGIATLLLTPLISILAFITVIGMPLGIILLLAWVIAMPIGFVASSYYAGTMIARQLNLKHSRAVVPLLVGLPTLIILSLLPFIGGLVVFLAIAWGIGGKVMTQYPGARKATSKSS